MHVFKCCCFFLSFIWFKSQGERMGMAGTENLHLLTWVFLVGNVTGDGVTHSCPQCLSCWKLQVSDGALNSGGTFGDGGVRECFLPISVSLNVEDQGEGTTGLACVHCRDALWKHWAWGGMRNGVVAWVNNLKFWDWDPALLPLLPFSPSILSQGFFLESTWKLPWSMEPE